VTSGLEDVSMVQSPIGLKEIARELGLSIGTVHRGLNGTRGISPATRARVLALAEQRGYRPNLAARLLQARRGLRVAVHLPRQAGLFWDALREGIRDAAAMLPGLEIEFETYAPGGGEVALLEYAVADRPDGLIIAPDDAAGLAPHFEEAARRGIAVVCVGADAPASPRLMSVCAEPFAVGATAGELLARFIPGGGSVGVFTSPSGSPDHAERLRGFTTRLSAVNPALTLGPVVAIDDDDRAAQEQARAVFLAHPHLNGLYIGTSQSLPVLRAAEHDGRLAGLSVVATDLAPDLVEWIRAGKVAATVDQRPLTQGHVAIRLLYQFLQHHQCPPAARRIVPDVVMGSTLDLVLEGRQAGLQHFEA
jgi:LacI family transcriptional regulator, galactose operon repressor